MLVDLYRIVWDDLLVDGIKREFEVNIQLASSFLEKSSSSSYASQIQALAAREAAFSDICSFLEFIRIRDGVKARELMDRSIAVGSRSGSRVFVIIDAPAIDPLYTLVFEDVTLGLAFRSLKSVKYK